MTRVISDTFETFCTTNLWKKIRFQNRCLRSFGSREFEKADLQAEPGELHFLLPKLQNPLPSTAKIPYQKLYKIPCQWRKFSCIVLSKSLGLYSKSLTKYCKNPLPVAQILLHWLVKISWTSFKIPYHFFKIPYQINQNPLPIQSKISCLIKQNPLENSDKIPYRTPKIPW